MSNENEKLYSSPTMWNGTLIGRIGKRTWENQGDSGNKTIGLAVAHDVLVRQADGTVKKETSWVDVVVFPSLVKRLDTYLTIGRLIAIDGSFRIKASNYQTKVNTRCGNSACHAPLAVPVTVNSYRVEMTADHIRLMPDGKAHTSKDTSTPGQAEVVNVTDEEKANFPMAEVVNPPAEGSAPAADAQQEIPVGAGVGDPNNPDDMPF